LALLIVETNQLISSNIDRRKTIMFRLMTKIISFEMSLVILATNLFYPVIKDANSSMLASNKSTSVLQTSPQDKIAPDNWRNWPVVPALSDKAKSILKSAAENGQLDLHAFSKVGDCQFTVETFLAGYVKGFYTVPDDFKETTHFFKESMARDSITSANGLGINSVLNPMFGRSKGYLQCDANETPLDCELRTRKPAIVLIAMGTNWKPFMEITFEEKLRAVVDVILASGALPVLATKADNIETDWKLNLAIARVAYDYDLPLVNVWRSVQGLPNNGLSAPVNEYLTSDGWGARNVAWIKTLEEIRITIDQ
jgi:hypothetical protein